MSRISETFFKPTVKKAQHKKLHSEIFENDSGSLPVNSMSADIETTEECSQQDCLLCFELKSNAVLMECGHGGLCFKCALDLFNNSRKCFICRARVTKVLHVKHEAEDMARIVSTAKLNV